MRGTVPAGYDERLARFAAYLAAKVPPDKLPGRQHIDPFEIPDLLPYLKMLDVVAQPNGDLRYRIRLAGTYVVDLLGIDGTGKFVDEIVTANREMDIVHGYDEMVATKEPQYLEGKLRGKRRQNILFQRIGFPLARNGVDVDMLVLMMVAFDPKRQKLIQKNSAGR